MRRIVGLNVLAAIVAGIGAMSAPAMAEPSGRNLALSCFLCHGPAGKSPDSIPGINGKSAAFIASNMMAFRDGARNSTVMQRIAKGYTDAEIKALASYLASLK